MDLILSHTCNPLVVTVDLKTCNLNSISIRITLVVTHSLIAMIKLYQYFYRISYTSTVNRQIFLKDKSTIITGQLFLEFSIIGPNHHFKVSGHNLET